MRITRRMFLAGAAAAAGVWGVAPATARAATKVKFTLPWIPHGGYTHIFVAKKLGFWEKRGLDVQIDRGFGSGEVCKTLGLGQYDFGEIDLAVMINCAAKGMDLLAIGNVSPRSPVGIFWQPKSGIQKPKDLEGKKVGFTVGSGDFQLWPAFVKATGIDDGKVQKVFMNAEALVKGFIEGQVDAVGNFYASIAPNLWSQGLEIDFVLYEEFGVKMYSLVFATRGPVAKEQPDLCAKFMEGAMEGLAYVYTNPEPSLEIHLDMVKEYKGSPTNREVVKHGQGIMTAMGIVPEVEQHGLGWMDPEMVKRTRDTVMTYMGATNAPPAEQIATNNFVGKVRLTPAEWAKVKDSVKRYLPKRA
jgi:NitT/TauT family transport system substrate-binding protein